ncbi:MAG: hypothetical protein ED556_01570 [Winogradskyella sp.]|uniref:hypothetical protein n=1 Tax=Winogradskyella sp. TaxID=1883156 RepID=UPI000F3F4541|nr:hypothetical protein [Winogradskyella sp.]RNC87905.1 MAG: hypothetical protein ED556_01570 [Winogradskyella sp.]
MKKAVFTFCLAFLTSYCILAQNATKAETYQYIKKNLSNFETISRDGSVITDNIMLSIYDNGDFIFWDSVKSNGKKLEIKSKFNINSIDIAYNDSNYKGNIYFNCKIGKCVQTTFNYSSEITRLTNYRLVNPSNIEKSKRLYKAFLHLKDLLDEEDPFKD